MHGTLRVKISRSRLSKIFHFVKNVRNCQETKKMHQISGNVRKCSSYYVFAGSCQKYGSQCLYILKPLIITAVP